MIDVESEFLKLIEFEKIKMIKNIIKFVLIK